MDETSLEYMRAALTMAEQAGVRGDLAVGAVIVLNGKIVGQGGNQATTAQDPMAHAEIVALHDFAEHHPGLTLEDGVLVTTFEPCPMCLGACLVFRVGTVVVGGTRKPEDQAWGRYRPEHLAAVSAAAGWALQVRPGPLGEECVRLRNASKVLPQDPTTTTQREGLTA